MLLHELIFELQHRLFGAHVGFVAVLLNLTPHLTRQQRCCSLATTQIFGRNQDGWAHGGANQTFLSNPTTCWM